MRHEGVDEEPGEPDDCCAMGVRPKNIRQDHSDAGGEGRFQAAGGGVRGWIVSVMC